MLLSVSDLTGAPLLQSKVLEHFPSPPLHEADISATTSEQPRVSGHTTFWVWVLLLCTFSLPGKSLPHLLCVTCLTSQAEVRGSQSRMHPLSSALWFPFYYITHHSSPLWNSVRPASPKWGVLRGKGSFWFTFTSPSHKSWFLAHREHSNICWKIMFLWVLAELTITL